MEVRINGYKLPTIIAVAALLLGSGGGVIGARVASPDVVELREKVSAMKEQLVKLDLQQAEQIKLTAAIGAQLAILNTIQDQLEDARTDVKLHEQRLTRIEAEIGFGANKRR